MLRRLFSSTPLIRFNCSNCRLYDKTTKLCKINQLNAIDNRMDNNICGIDGKKYNPLDTTNLIKSERYEKYSYIVRVFAIASLPPMICYDAYFVGFALLIGDLILSEKSINFKDKYLEDNDLMCCCKNEIKLK